MPLLRNKRIIGSLNLGSVDPTRFTPALGTDFIEHMASIIAICLENVISNEMLKYIGLTDSLTGVYNRRYIDRRLLEEIGRARRQAYRISCMYIDIDHFKAVNDSVGHQGGDEVLREVAGRIKAELRLSDALGRFGGEEFVVLLIDADLESAKTCAQRIRASIADTPFELSSWRTAADFGIDRRRHAGRFRARPRDRRRGPAARRASRYRALPGQGKRPQPGRHLRLTLGLLLQQPSFGARDRVGRTAQHHHVARRQ